MLARSGLPCLQRTALPQITLHPGRPISNRDSVWRSKCPTAWASLRALCRITAPHKVSQGCHWAQIPNCLRSLPNPPSFPFFYRYYSQEHSLINNLPAQLSQIVSSGMQTTAVFYFPAWTPAVVLWGPANPDRFPSCPSPAPVTRSVNLQIPQTPAGLRTFTLDGSKTRFHFIKGIQIAVGCRSLVDKTFHHFISFFYWMGLLENLILSLVPGTELCSQKMPR